MSNKAECLRRTMVKDDLMALSSRFDIKELVKILGRINGVQTKTAVLQG